MYYLRMRRAMEGEEGCRPQEEMCHRHTSVDCADNFKGAYLGAGIVGVDDQGREQQV